MSPNRTTPRRFLSHKEQRQWCAAFKSKLELFTLSCLFCSVTWWKGRGLRRSDGQAASLLLVLSMVLTTTRFKLQRQKGTVTRSSRSRSPAAVRAPVPGRLIKKALDPLPTFRLGFPTCLGSLWKGNRGNFK